MIKWGHMNIYILLENTVNQMLFSFFFLNPFLLYSSFYGTLIKCVAQVISERTVLEVVSEAQVAWANKPTACTHIPVAKKM